MPRFGKLSTQRLSTCDERLQELCNEAIKYFDFSVLCGNRGEIEQNKLYREGKTQLKYPQSRHNKLPAMAVDIAPYPIDWEDTDRFYFLGGLMIGLAARKGIKLRWGGDWDMDGKFDDERFRDLPHFEILN